jgi:signal transduction histidine kinase
LPRAGDLEILVLAPTGQDATLVAGALAREQIESRIFRNMAELCQWARRSAGAILIAEEALGAEAVNCLNETLALQPPWSDIPLVVMTTAGESTLASLKVLRAFSPSGNVTLLERPFRSLTLISVMQVALRARKRQFQVRDLLEAQVKATNIRDEFISIASHELKTPLTALKLQSQISKWQAKNTDAPMTQEQISKFVNLTSNQVDRLTRLVEDMLDVSRINSQKLLLERTTFDLVELAEEIIDRLTPQLETAGCETELVQQGPVAGVWDRYRIEQILYNLLTNAIRYAPGKPVKVEVLQEEHTGVIRVSDQGGGIAPENQERIFQRFERAVASNNISGLGLGLYICKQIAESHQGSISVESELGRGSVFTVRLPIQEISATVTPVSASSANTG